MVLFPHYVSFPIMGFASGVIYCFYSDGKPKDTRMMESAIGWMAIFGCGLVGMTCGTVISWIV
jgi:hypothetical protein